MPIQSVSDRLSAMGQVQATDAGIRNTTHMGSRVKFSYS